jgi:hypothetical protein
MISVRPLVQQLRQVLGQTPLDLEDRAVERWTISPGTRRTVPAARFLDGQLDRILGTEFGAIEDVVRDLRGGFESSDDETLGFRLKDVDYVDGVLYGPGGVRHLRQRSRWRPGYRVPTEVVSGALYETWIGNRWFGSWLMEDCVRYELARRHGQPVTTAPLAAQGHAKAYEQRLDMHPRRVSAVHFDELIIFRDSAGNEGKRQRAQQMRDRLVANVSGASHPGVFILRGQAGDRRVLLNEMALAQQLAARRGFKVLGPLASSVDEIVGACAGARVVAGVEGSQLVHGLVCMPPDAALLVIQPPHRVVSVLKLVTDRQGQTFGFVVASGGNDEFTVDADEVERTLDLLDRA